MSDADGASTGASTSSASTVDAAGSLRRTIDAFNALGLASRTFRGLAATARFSRMAVDAGQPHAPSGEGEGGDAVGIEIGRALILEGPTGWESWSPVCTQCWPSQDSKLDETNRVFVLHTVLFVN